ncbi:hypothetical protein IPA_03115 [Ignicoccus pacificus DSM 13166]|uniref:Uncharacterized protein n=1 Tax=Ignicoccus pacificus DSM 13166 TaxID=940294 RepID=A0A977KCC9_9CREN|nr:hypothetical protein IPA_03115 [Ignicoccus pacificus DSM 13166]
MSLRFLPTFVLVKLKVLIASYKDFYGSMSIITLFVSTVLFNNVIHTRKVQESL